ncbi:MAG: hypothetical protein ACYDC8_17360 [Gammaproteobacteria bacterium]
MASTTSTLFNTIPDDMLGFWANQTLQPREVVEFLDFQKADVAKVANVPVKSVRYDERIPKVVVEHLEQIAIICGLVAEFFAADAHKTALWFRTKNPMLGNLSPRDMIRYGRMEKLRQIVQDARAANGFANKIVSVKTTQVAAHGEARKASSTAASH